MLTLIRKGNGKLADIIAVFNLPVIPITICRGAASPGCLDWCFGIKFQQFKNVWKALVANWDASKRNDFVDRMVDEIRRSGVKVVSPHHNADFYSQEYVEKWAQIARRLPGILFYTYSKSLDLDLTPLTSLPNFTVIKSYGGRFDHLIDKQRDNYSTVVGILDQKHVAEGEYACPEISPGRNESEKFCGNLCDYCISDHKHKIRVVFLEKRAGWNGRRIAPPGTNLTLTQRQTTP